MGYLIVFLVSVAVGVAVFFTTMRGVALPRFSGFDGAPDRTPPPADPGPGMSYVPVASGRHDWQARLTGVLGLVVSVVVAGIALAVSIYALGALVARLFSGVGGGDAGSTG